MNKNLNLDLRLIPMELKLLIDIIISEDDEKLTSNIVRCSHEIDWKLFIELALHHRIYPLLCSKMKNISNNIIPIEVTRTIINKYKWNTFQMLNLCREMDQINKVCFNNQIRILFLKGPVLAKELFGDISLRTSSDIDVLISIKDLGKIEDILEKSGYVKDDYIETVLGDWKWRHHHLTYIHQKKNIKVEVHWRLNPGPSKEPCFEHLWKRKRISTVTNSKLYFLGKEDLFLFLVSHGARHGWSRLRWLIDIQYLIKQNLDWDLLNSLCKKYHYQYIGGQAIILVNQLLKTNINERVKRRIVGRSSNRLAQEAIFYMENMVNLHTEPLPDAVAKYHKHHLFHLMSRQQKLIFILSFLYPYPSDAEILPLPKILHFLYFPLRPFLWIWKKTKIQATLRRTNH